jgi:Fe-S-cluster containining protein
MSGKRRRQPGTAEKERESALLQELAAIYAEADEAYAGYRCAGSTECCRFAITGREPYVTSIEIAAVKRAVAARGGALGDKRRALPLAPADTRATERTCPMLDAGARCSIYAWRPLGCRSFWCDRAETEREVVHRALLELVRKVQVLAAEHEPGGDKGRPLTRALS